MEDTVTPTTTPLPPDPLVEKLLDVLLEGIVFDWADTPAADRPFFREIWRPLAVKAAKIVRNA